MNLMPLAPAATIANGDSPGVAASATTVLDERLATLARRLRLARAAVDGLTTSLPGGEHAAICDRIDSCFSVAEELGDAIEELNGRLARAETLNYEQRLQLQARSQESQTDVLTGLANRRDFERQFEQRSHAARFSHSPVTVAILDVDHFKSINDTRGHAVGDAVLRQLASFLQENLPAAAHIARFGGEEFAVLLDGVPLERAIDIFDEVRAGVAHVQFLHEGQVLALTLSCGIAQLKSHEHREQLLERADVALYAAKQAGRNRTFWHDGHSLHLAAPEPRHGIAPGQQTESVSRVLLDLGASGEAASPKPAGQLPSFLIPRSSRVNWCDAGALHWFLWQRLAEWKRFGDTFCVLAIDVDESAQIRKLYGAVALHFMMRAQMLHFDAVFRDMDVVARTDKSQVVVVLPRTDSVKLPSALRRLKATMGQFSFPTKSGLVEYSVSVGATEPVPQDDAQQLIQRASAALAVAQDGGKGRFFANEDGRIREIEVSREA